MERPEWLKEMRSKAEALYDHGAPLYWVTWGMDNPETHRAHLQMFLGMMPPRGVILSEPAEQGALTAIWWKRVTASSVSTSPPGC